MSDYLKYIPILTSNHTLNAILLTTAPALLYTAAAYGHLFLQGATLALSILIAVIFATLEYIIRVPIIKYSSDVALMSNTTMQVIWMGLTLLMSFGADKLMIKK